MPWFDFRQNNSGGSFDFDTQNGLTVHVLIEAKDGAEANRLAQAKGIYFDGCESGIDCSCCGDRWSPVDGVGTNEPCLWGEPLRDATVWVRWSDGTKCKEVALHHHDGRVTWFTPPVGDTYQRKEA